MFFGVYERGSRQNHARHGQCQGGPATTFRRVILTCLALLPSVPSIPTRASSPSTRGKTNPRVKKQSHREAVKRTREEIKRAVEDMREVLEEFFPAQAQTQSEVCDC